MHIKSLPIVLFIYSYFIYIWCHHDSNRHGLAFYTAMLIIWPHLTHCYTMSIEGNWSDTTASLRITLATWSASKSPDVSDINFVSSGCKKPSQNASHKAHSLQHVDKTWTINSKKWKRYTVLQNHYTQNYPSQRKTAKNRKSCSNEGTTSQLRVAFLIFISLLLNWDTSIYTVSQ